MEKADDLISRIQEALREFDIPAWLFYGFQDIDPIAARILKFRPDHLATRRWFYLVPGSGKPGKLVHRIESSVLDHLPGDKTVYLTWTELQSRLKRLLRGLPRAAMQYSEKNGIPYVSRVDGGTVDLVQSCGTRVISSADLMQRFEAVWSEEQIRQHRQTALGLTDLVRAAFERAAEEVKAKKETSELAIQKFLLDSLQAEDLVAEHPPIVAVNQNSANPHYGPTKENDSKIRQGDFLLIDLWAKSPRPAGVYADITWVGFLGPSLPEKIGQTFDVVRRARNRGVDFLRERFSAGNPPGGWEVDDAVRAVVREAGMEEYFVHRTGHNLGEQVHGTGVHFDNLETQDTRQVIPGIACTIEPGIYLPGRFGVRSEINVYISGAGPEVTTPPQDEVLVLAVS